MTGTSSWRTVDIVVTAAIAVAFGVVFWAWNAVWAAATPAFAAVPPAQNILYGVWLVPAVLAGLVVRKPGAALFAELVAASVSAILGSQWGLDTLVSGAIQGLAAELVFFALARYRVFTLIVAIVAGAATAVGAWIHDMPLYYPDLSLTDQLVIGAFMIVSAVIVAGIGSWFLMQALAQTGVLAQFPSGRAQTRV
jgi:energy-coupling factor transport system substrate-specific component